MTWTPDMPDRRSASDMVSWKSYVDRVFEEHRLQVATALVAHDQRVETNRHAATERLDALAKHIGMQFIEQQRAIKIAEREREKASQALRSEQHRATDAAEREREKAAQALAITLGTSIHEGDERLREHIHNQVEQINAALTAVEGRALLRHDSVTAEFGLRQKASDAAVQKAEDAQKDVNERGNEFRGQLKDQNATMMPRLEAEALLKEVRSAQDKLDDKLVLTNTRIEKSDGVKTGVVERRNDQRASTGMIVGIASAAVAFVGLIVVLANVLASAP